MLRLNDLPVIKMVLHAAKYPDCAVNGVLLCNQADSSCLVVDYIPLFHQALTLTPMLEVALYQIDSLCASKNLKICGYFQANEHVDNKVCSMSSNISQWIQNAIDAKYHRQLVDFDDHLNDPNCDFLNVELSKLLTTSGNS